MLIDCKIGFTKNSHTDYKKIVKFYNYSNINNNI